MSVRFVMALAATAALSGCANGYKNFYHEIPGATPERIAATREGSPAKDPKVDHTGLPANQIAQVYGEAGYAAIGYSSFNGGGGAADSGAIAQAKAVGADLVVISNPQYTGTRSSVVPIVTPTSSTSYTTGSATAYGRGAPVTAYGSATTTTYGTQTNYIPVNTDRFDYAAVYMIKQHSLLGVQVRDLNNDERAALQTNRGVVIQLVVRGTPAFRNDLLVGDVIQSIDDQPIEAADGFGDLVTKHRGKTITLKIRRNGDPISKSIQLAN